jgi:hypothetical protein
MEITVDTANVMVDAMTARLNGGSLRLYDGRGAFPTLLVSVPFGTPAFMGADNGIAVAHAVPPTPALVSGEVQAADLVSASGAVVAQLTVRAQDALDAAQADAVIDRTDVQRGGLCTVGAIVLTLPQSS